MINNEITETLRLNVQNEPLNIHALEKIDAILLSFYKQNLATQEASVGAAEVESVTTSQKAKPGTASQKAG